LEYLVDQFLIAMPSMADPNFEQTVTYVCEHNADGALGLVINRPLDMNLGEVFDQLDLGVESTRWLEQPIYRGGPVQSDRGFVLHDLPETDWDSSLRVSDVLAVTTSQDILASMARGEGPERALFALGYAGWGAGQLEEEMAANAWLSVPADPAVIFDTPSEHRWHAAARLLGVDLQTLTSYSGSA
jgi:putative transcriptional regulator